MNSVGTVWKQRFVVRVISGRQLERSASILAMAVTDVQIGTAIAIDS